MGIYTRNGTTVCSKTRKKAAVYEPHYRDMMRMGEILSHASNLNPVKLQETINYACTKFNAIYGVKLSAPRSDLPAPATPLVDYEFEYVFYDDSNCEDALELVEFDWTKWDKQNR